MVQTTFSCRYAAIHLVYHPFIQVRRKVSTKEELFSAWDVSEPAVRYILSYASVVAYEIVFGGFYV